MARSPLRRGWFRWLSGLAVLAVSGCIFPLPEVVSTVPPPKPAAIVCLAPPNDSGLSINPDGKEDLLWRGQPTQSIDQVVLGKVESAADLSGNFRMLYDPYNLYLFAVVTDDHLVSTSADPQQDDGVELYLDTADLSHGRASGYGDHQFHFVFPWNKTTPWEKASRTEGVQYVVTNLSDAYQLEAVLPWTTLALGGGPSPGQTIGLEVMINDADSSSGGVTKKLAWFGHDERAVTDPRAFGSGTLSRGFVFGRTNVPPRIDGAQDVAWGTQPAYPLRRTLDIQGRKVGNFTASLSGVWDAENLYLLFDVRDAVLVPNPGSDPLGDGVEVFANDGQGDATYGPHDLHLLYGYGALKQPLEAHGISGAFTAAYGDVAGASEYRVEMSIPWGALNLTPGVGVIAGFEAWVNNYVPNPNGGGPDGGGALRSSPLVDLSGVGAPSSFDGGFRTLALEGLDGGDPVTRPSDVGLIQLE